jgi:hypothetical protein
MRDRRTYPCNGRVAAQSLRGQVDGVTFVKGHLHNIIVPMTNLLALPNGKRERQLLMGEGFLVLEMLEGFAFGQAERDGFVGYVATSALAVMPPSTHRVAAKSTHLYPSANLKDLELSQLSYGSKVSVAEDGDRFAKLANGTFIPKIHLKPVSELEIDPVSVAEIFLGTPYLWGGNSIFGIDCSGLVQVSYLTCGIACLGDSDLQQTSLGVEIPLQSPIQRGDLFFWRGHVAMASDSETIIHANAYRMAVTYEPVKPALQRIDANGDDPLLVRRRVAIGLA